MKLSEAFEKYLKEEFEPYIGSEVSEVTYINLKSFARFFDKLDTDLEFFDKTFVLDFWKMLKEKGLKMESTVPKRMSTLKTFANYLQREGYIIVNPCHLVRKSLFQETYTVNRGLDKKQIKVLKQAKLKGSEARERDLFLLRIYTGMSYIETKNFTKDWIVERDGYRMIKGYRNKTGVEFRVPITEETQYLIDKLILKDGKLPVKSNEYQNKVLRKIGDELGLPKLSTHVARHTTGSFYKSRGVPLDVIKVFMGHSSIVTTDKRYGEHDDAYLTKMIRKNSQS